MAGWFDFSGAGLRLSSIPNFFKRKAARSAAAGRAALNMRTNLRETFPQDILRLEALFGTFRDESPAPPHDVPIVRRLSERFFFIGNANADQHDRV